MFSSRAIVMMIVSDFKRETMQALDILTCGLLGNWQEGMSDLYAGFLDL